MRVEAASVKIGGPGWIVVRHAALVRDEACFYFPNKPYKWYICRDAEAIAD